MMALDFLTQAFTGKGLADAASREAAGARQGYTDLAALYGQAGQSLNRNYMSAIAPYQNLQPGATGGASAYADATGANGPEGLARARAMFTQMPGYTEGMKAATDETTRSLAAQGVAAGNIGAGVADRTNRYVNDLYGQYVQRLNPYLQYSLGTAGGISEGYRGLGNAESALLMSQGQQASSAANAEAKALADQERAKYIGSQNFMNFAGNLGSAALNAFAPGAGTLMKTAG